MGHIPRKSKNESPVTLAASYVWSIFLTKVWVMSLVRASHVWSVVRTKGWLISHMWAIHIWCIVRTQEWVMSHVWACHVWYTNDFCYTCRTSECVTSHVWMGRITHLNESCHRCVHLKISTIMSHVPHMNGSCKIHKWVMSHTSHIWMRHVTQMNQSCRRWVHLQPFRCAVSLIWTSHVSYVWTSHGSFVLLSHVSYISMSHLSHIYEWVMSHMCDRGVHLKNFNARCHTSERVLSLMSDCVMSHMCKWVTSHIVTGGVISNFSMRSATHLHESCLVWLKESCLVWMSHDKTESLLESVMSCMAEGDMSRVNESWHDWVMTRISHVLYGCRSHVSWMSHDMNELWHEWVMSRMFGEVTSHMSNWVICLKASCLTCVTGKCIWKPFNVQCHISEQVMSHTSERVMSHMCEWAMYHQSKWVMSHMSKWVMSHVCDRWVHLKLFNARCQQLWQTAQADRDAQYAQVTYFHNSRQHVTQRCS